MIVILVSESMGSVVHGQSPIRKSRHNQQGCLGHSNRAPQRERKKFTPSERTFDFGILVTIRDHIVHRTLQMPANMRLNDSWITAKLSEMKAGQCRSHAGGISMAS